MSNVRQRPSAKTTENTTDSNDTSNMNDDLVQGRGLSAPSLLRSAPSHHGCVMKLHVPLTYKILPTILQNYLVRSSLCRTLWCTKFMIPTWKERYLIMLGNYIYSFKDSNSVSPKGTPILVQGISQVDLLDDTVDEEIIIPDMPPGCDSMFYISTFGKARYYAVSSAEEQAETWVNFVKEGRQEVITRSMGHSNVPLPSSWRYFDSLANDLVNSRNRIRKRVENLEQREVEMTGFMDNAAPRGYYS